MRGQDRNWKPRKGLWGGQRSLDPPVGMGEDVNPRVMGQKARTKGRDTQKQVWRNGVCTLGWISCRGSQSNTAPSTVYFLKNWF